MVKKAGNVNDISISNSFFIIQIFCMSILFWQNTNMHLFSPLLAKWNMQFPHTSWLQLSNQLLFTQGWIFFPSTFVNTSKQDKSNLCTCLFVCVIVYIYIYTVLYIYKYIYICVYTNVECFGRSTASDSSVISLTFHAVYGIINAFVFCLLQFFLPDCHSQCCLIKS